MTALKKTVCAIELKGITKRFGDVVANDSIDLSLNRGEILSLLGENGSGKTTLMNMLSGIYFPDEGEILIGGEPVSIRSPKDAYAHGIGMIHQHYKLVDVFTATENIVLGLEEKGGLDIRAAAEKVRTICDRYGFDMDPNQKIYDMSVSQKQTVEIVKVLYRGADILILDEPTAGLDPRERVRFRNLIHSLAAERTVILSTHIVSDIETIAGQIVMFRDHRLYCCDSPASICSRFQGKVFEVPAGAALEPGQFLLSERQGEQGPILRLLCDTPPADGVPVTPGLEDAFLAIYREGAA